MNYQNLDKYEELYNRLKKHLKQLEDISSLIDSIEEDKSSLENFYYNDWLSIIDNQHDKSYKILEEDSICNLLDDLHSKKIIILKKIVSNIN